MMKSRWMLTSVGAVALVVAGAGSSGAQSTTSGVSSVVRSHEEAVVEAAAWSESADAILAAREQASGRRFSPALRARLLSGMSGTSHADLESFKDAGATGRLPHIPNVLGASGSDLLFTPVAPCRIVNTVATGTPLAASTSRAFYVNGNAAAVFEAQGGNAGGCGIPDAATAVAMNFIAVGPAGPGNLRAYPWNATPTLPNASVINYANVSGLNIANGLAQPVCDAASTTCTFDLIVRADAAQTHVIIDVVGYYQSHPSLVDRRAAFTFADVPASGTDGTFSSITFTPEVSGTVELRSRGWCNEDALGGTVNEIQVSAGVSAAAAFAASLGERGIIRIPAELPASGNFALAFNSHSTLAVTAGSATTVTLFGRHPTGAGTGICGGTFIVRQIFP